MIRHTRSMFVVPHTDSSSADRPFLFLRVNVSRVGEEAFRRCLFEYMSQSIFFGPHTFFFDLPHTIHVCFAAFSLIWRENVSQAGEETFRRCIFEYMSQSIFFGPHTDYCLF